MTVTLRELGLLGTRSNTKIIPEVGYYPRSDFVHIDTGRVRTW